MQILNSGDKKPVFRIHTRLNADPDPGFYLNADPDVDPDADPDSVSANKYLKL